MTALTTLNIVMEESWLFSNRRIRIFI